MPQIYRPRNEATDEERRKIAQFLELDPTDNNWVIDDLDRETGLFLVHYNKECAPVEYHHLRGLVVDIKTGMVICKSFPAPNRIIMAEIPPGNSEGVIIVEDEFEKQVKFNPDQVILTHGYEGPMIRIFKFAGKIYLAGSRRLDCRKTRWGSTKNIGTAFDQAGGQIEELFETGDYSPYSYNFILVDPDFLISSKIPINDKNFMVFVGVTLNWDPDHENFKDLSIDRSLKNPSVKETAHLFGTSDRDFEKIHAAYPLTIDEANDFLSQGFHQINQKSNDPRLSNGEFVTLTGQDVDGQAITYRIESIAYHWRNNIRSGENNLYHLFYGLMHQAHQTVAEISMIVQTKPDNWETLAELALKTFKFKFVDFDFEPSILVELDQKPVIDFSYQIKPMTNEVDHQALIFAIHLSMIASMPLHRQKEVSSFYNLYCQDLVELSTKLIKISKLPSFYHQFYSLRNREFVEMIRHWKNFGFSDDLIAHRLNASFMDEEPGSLYHMVRSIKQIELQDVKTSHKFVPKNQSFKPKEFTKQPRSNIPTLTLGDFMPKLKVSS